LRDEASESCSPEISGLDPMLNEMLSIMLS